MSKSQELRKLIVVLNLLIIGMVFKFTFQEKELVNNNIFTKVLIAKKKKRGTIIVC